MLALICILAVALFFLDLQNRKKSADLKRYRYAARHDHLTGLYNRTTFFEECSRMLQRQPDASYFLVRWEIANFSVFNDLYGVAAGDALLQKLSQYANPLAVPVPDGALGPGLDTTAVCYGYLGKNHFVFCTSLPEELLVKRLQQVQKLLGQMHPDFAVRGRFGLLRLKLPCEDLAAASDGAALALRNQAYMDTTGLAWYNETMARQVQEEQNLVKEMQSSLEKGEFKLYVQPIYNCLEHKVSLAEILLRWEHPQAGLFVPGKFIPAFEKNSFMWRLDNFVWAQSLAWLQEYLGVGHAELGLSFNVSRVDFYSPNFVETLTALCKQYQIPTRLIHLEFNESAYVQAPKAFENILQQLHDQGFRLALDNFGTNSSSITSLKQLPADVLKLDMAFAKDDGEGGKGGKLYQSLVQMARWIGLDVVAEGVETGEEVDFAESLGCSYVQGYYLSKPLPLKNFADFLQDKAAKLPVNQVARRGILSVSDFWNPDNACSLLFNSLAGAVAVVEFDGEKLTFVRLNSTYFASLGFSRKILQLLKKDVLTDVWPEDIPVCKAAALQAARTKTEVGFSYRIKAGQNGIFWLRTRMRYLEELNGKLLFLTTSENITAVKQKELTLQTENSKLYDMLAYLPSGVLLYRIKGQTLEELYYNKAVAEFRNEPECRCLFAPELKAPGKFMHVDEAVFTVVYWEDVALVREAWQKVVRDRTDVNLYFRSWSKSGELRWLRCSLLVLQRRNPLGKKASSCRENENAAAILTAPNGSMERSGPLDNTFDFDVLVLLDDVTSKMFTDKSDRSQERRYRIIMENTSVLIFDYDVIRDRMELFLRQENGGLQSKQIEKYRSRLGELNSRNQEAGAYMLDTWSFITSKPGSGNFEYRADYGQGQRWYRAHYVSLVDDSGRVDRVMGRAEDIQSDKEKNDTLRHRAAVDMLTGVYNRVNSELLINDVLLQKPLATHAMIEVDVDNFKNINDHYGHPTGDVVLQEIAGILKDVSRWTDIVGRLGGDEFLVFLPELADKAILEHKLQDIINKVTILQEKHKFVFPVTLSLGAVLIKPGICSFADAFSLADEALYFAKKNGKNQFYIKN